MSTRHRDFTGLIRRVGRSVLLVAVALGSCGCALVGPQSISAGRGVYAEVINRTEDEQILNVIVRMRYDETFSMLSVASVTANLSFSTRAGLAAARARGPSRVDGIPKKNGPCYGPFGPCDPRGFVATVNLN